MHTINSPRNNVILSCITFRISKNTYFLLTYRYGTVLVSNEKHWKVRLEKRFGSPTCPIQTISGRCICRPSSILDQTINVLHLAIANTLISSFSAGYRPLLLITLFCFRGFRVSNITRKIQWQNSIRSNLVTPPIISVNKNVKWRPRPYVYILSISS